MILEKGKKVLLCIGAVVMPVITAGAIFVGSNNAIKRSDASAYSATLNSANSPTLSGGSGTTVDSKNITWEYNNAKDYNNGHVSLNNTGYFGISSSSIYGYSTISNISVNFQAGSDGELWLLKSVNGTEWHEAALLKESSDITSTNAQSTAANDWRYVRFYYNWGSNNSSIDIDSVSLGYECSESRNAIAAEDVDCAHVENIIASSGVSYAVETTEISPNSTGGEAVRFTKTSSQTTITFSLGRTYTLGEVAYSKIEFDVWTTVTNYGRKITLMKDNTSIQSTADTNNTNSYVWTSLGNNWWHAEIPFTFFVSLISGYNKKDIPTAGIENKQFNAVQINQGSCIIDNLRIGSTACDLGIYNGKDYKPSVGEIYWVKTSWVGKLRPELCEITFDDDTMARHIPITDSNLKFKGQFPFYVELLGSGDLEITVKVVCGYNRRVQTITKTITVN